MSQFLNHLHVVFHTLLYALCADMVAKTLEEVYLFYKVVLYESYGLFGLFL